MKFNLLLFAAIILIVASVSVWVEAKTALNGTLQISFALLLFLSIIGFVNCFFHMEEE